ncbi:MAG: hypothetical protein ACPGPE_00725 [Planctomycetota bacterium]
MALIVVAPGRKPGVSGRPVGLIDVSPTPLELAGLAPDHGLEGHSLAPLLDDPTGAGPHAAVTTFGPGNHTIRSTRWRYTRYADGSEELYDHDEDPHEWRSPAVCEPRPEAVSQVVAELRERLPVDDAPIRGKAEGSAGLEAFRSAGRGR